MNDPIVLIATKLFNGRVLTKKEEVPMSFDLSRYKPEPPGVTTREPFNYKGRCNILFARIEESERASEFYQTSVGSKVLSICVEVPEDAVENAKRRIYKKWQIDSTIGNSKGKTPVEQAADWLCGAGILFTNIVELENCLEKLVTGDYGIHAWAIKISGEPVQMSKLIEAEENIGSEVSPF